MDRNSTDKPPVPPRRLKRKNKIVSLASNATTTTEHLSSQQKHPSLPPPPPIRPKKYRRKKSQSVEIYKPQCHIASLSKSENAAEHSCESMPFARIIEAKSSGAYDNTIYTREKNLSSETNGNRETSKAIVTKPLFHPFDIVSKRRLVDKYPPLFFTLHDYQDVMSATLLDRDDDSQRRTFAKNVDDKQKLLKKKGEPFFILNKLDDDDDDDVNFRVTTTSIPFGKCLETWRLSLDTNEFSRDFNDYQFKDSADKHDIKDITKSYNYEISDNKSDYGNGRKVRFAIESSPAANCINSNEQYDNLQTCEFIDKQSIVKITEIQNKPETTTDHNVSYDKGTNAISTKSYNDKDNNVKCEMSNNNNSADNITIDPLKIKETRQLLLSIDSDKTESFDREINEILPSRKINETSLQTERDSFLQTMLSNNSTDTRMNCAVIAARTEIFSSNTNKELSFLNKLTDTPRELSTNDKSENSNKLNVAMTMDMDDQNILRELKEKKDDVKSTQSKNKGVDDVKSEVLNELLCNFNNIKLKLVKVENKKPTTKGTNNEESTIEIDNTIFNENTSANFKSQIRERSRDRKVRDDVHVNVSATTSIGGNNDRTIVERIVKEKIAVKSESNSFSTKAENSHVKTEMKESLENTKSSDNIERKSVRDICSSQTIFNNNYDRCVNIFQNRIPIEAPATMNTIFNSRKFETVIRNMLRSSDLDDERKCGEASQKKTHEGKTDEEYEARRSSLALKLTTDSGDKCAIVKKTTSVVTPCNNNDNNKAVLSNTVRNDQLYRDDIVTITPGKVKNFIKYYEIRGDDATTIGRNSKINDRVNASRRKCAKSQATAAAVSIVAKNRPQQPEVITVTGKTTEENRSTVKSTIHRNADILKVSSDKIQPFVLKTPKDFSYSPAVCKVTEDESQLTKQYDMHISYEPNGEAHTQFSVKKTGAKKSTRFLGKFTQVHSENLHGNKCTMIVTGTNCSSSRESGALGESRDLWHKCDSRQAPPREIRKIEDQETEGSHSRHRIVVAQAHTVTRNRENSGINRFVPSPNTSQLVFYCTV